MALGDMQYDVAVPVEATGAVSVDFARRPSVAIPGFPDQRRVLGIDAHTLDIALEAQRHGARGHGIGEANQEHVIRLRYFVEAEERRACLERLGVVADLFLAAERGGEPGERAGDDRQVADGGKDDRLVGLGAQGGGLGPRPNMDGSRLRAREPERDRGPCRGRGKEPDADQFEEFDVVALRNSIEPVQDLVRHPGEGLDQRDTRVRHVVIGPLGAALLHEALGIIDQILEAPIVEVRDWKCHAHPPPADLLFVMSSPAGLCRTGRPGCGDRWSRRPHSGCRCK